MNDPIVGGTGLPLDVQHALSDLISVVSERYHFQQGETAAFWAMAYTLAAQLGEGKK